MPETAHKRQLISTVYATPLMTPTTALGLSIRLSMFELRETGKWDIFRAVGFGNKFDYVEGITVMGCPELTGTK